MGFVIIKIGVVILGLLSIFLLFSKDGEVAKNEVIFSLMTFYIFAMTYINYSMVDKDLFSKKSLILTLALLACIANFIKKKSYVISRVLMNVGILMNIYLLLT